MREEYTAARKLAQKKYKKDIQNGRSPYPANLDAVLAGIGSGGEEYLGLQEISLAQVRGTKEAARTNAFGSTFLPLLPENSEFAFKWSNLYEAQMEEGIREPVIAFEYLNEYYIREGNKRVSIMKYLEMPDIAAYVTRILPKPSDEERVITYQRFLKFYRKTKIADILFTDKNGYDQLEAAAGLAGECSGIRHFETEQKRKPEEPDAAWNQEEPDRKAEEIRRCYHRFRYAYRKSFGDVDDFKTGDAFLVALALHPFEELKSFSSVKFAEVIREMAKEVKPSSREKRPEYALDPKDSEPTLLGRVLPVLPQQLSAAFVYDQRSDESAWVYAHELGRMHVEGVFGDRICTSVYESVSLGRSASDVLEEVIRDGNQVIFTATPNLIQASVKAALAHPEVKIMNCSLYFNYQSVHTYYARSFEVKFLLGVLAGVLTQTDRIIYEADYPIYGTAANINAFALGVKMVNPKARVLLHWDCVKVPDEGGAPGGGEAAVPGKESVRADFASENSFPESTVSEKMTADFVSARHMIKAPDSNAEYGLYRRKDGVSEGYATCVFDWGILYENIIRAILNGRFQNRENLWWGLSSGVIDLVVSTRVPEATRRLIDALKPMIRAKSTYPFEGVFTDQSGKKHGKEDTEMSQEEIIHMDWLLDNVDGRVPEKEELKEEALEIVNLQGM